MKLTKRTMTSRQRAAVVELLRCAADQGPSGWGLTGVYGAADDDATLEIVWRVLNGLELPYGEYRFALLEAAARVEEGRWP